MKKLHLIAALVLCLCAALPASAQFRYGAVLGGTATNLKFKQDLAPVSQVPGFQTGVIGELMFPGIGFGIDLGLLYNLGGAKVNLGDKLIWSSEGYGNVRVAMHQLNIPLHLRFKYTRLDGLEEIIAPFVYGGPEFDILLAHGKCKAFEYPGGALNLCVGGGFELFKRWQISGSYTWGMTYAVQTSLLQNYTARTRQWTVRLTRFF